MHQSRQHVVDMRPATIAGQHLFPANDQPARLMDRVNRDIHQERQLWMKVGQFFHDSADQCKYCGYCSTVEGAPGERLNVCDLVANPMGRPTDCPALQADLAADADAESTGGVL